MTKEQLADIKHGAEYGRFSSDLEALAVIRDLLGHISALEAEVDRWKQLYWKQIK